MRVWVFGISGAQVAQAAWLAAGSLIACGQVSRSSSAPVEPAGAAGAGGNAGGSSGASSAGPIAASANGGSESGAGPAMAGAGNPGTAGAPMQYVPPYIIQNTTRPPPSLCVDGSCARAGQRCYRITKDFGICDDAVPVLANDCTPLDSNVPPVDHCGCNDLSCPEGRVCRRLEPECSCPPQPYNACVEPPCTIDADCGDALCVPASLIADGSRCMTPECRADSDCSLAPGGRCSAELTYPNQSGNVRLAAVRCAYPTP